MPIPEIAQINIEGNTIYKTLTMEKAWRLIYNEDNEVTHLFESNGITLAPTTMKCFETNKDAGVEIENKKLKCYKAVIFDNKTVESLTENKTNTVIIPKEKEKIFYSADLNDFEIHAMEQKLDTAKVENLLAPTNLALT